MTLPQALRASFWDCDFAALDAVRDRDFVIGRVLAAGTWEAIEQVRALYGDPAIRDSILAHRARLLSSEQIRLWELLLDLPADQVADWLADPARQLWESSGAA